MARGDERIDLAYRVPPQAKEAALELSALLDQADEYCRAGEHLLTLAIGSGPRALGRWFLGEFVAQIDGGAPTSWDQFASPSSNTT